jgi:hypothetical protein
MGCCAGYLLARRPLDVESTRMPACGPLPPRTPEGRGTALGRSCCRESPALITGGIERGGAYERGALGLV